MFRLTLTRREHNHIPSRSAPVDR